ncbi:MAG: DUF1934 domain-containing protein [Clostridia bacterium]|nr:DUF1934 domain-containing protein [Clostridia bacterium]
MIERLMTNALVSIESRQVFEDNEEAVKIAVEGSFYCRNGKYYILYEEKENSASCIVKVNGNVVSITRKGAYNSQFLCEEGKKFSATYRMPYGNMDMDIETECVKISLGENGGNIALKYFLTVNGERYLNNIDILVIKNKQ